MHKTKSRHRNINMKSTINTVTIFDFISLGSAFATCCLGDIVLGREECKTLVKPSMTGLNSDMMMLLSGLLEQPVRVLSVTSAVSVSDQSFEDMADQTF